MALRPPENVSQTGKKSLLSNVEKGEQRICAQHLRGRARVAPSAAHHLPLVRPGAANPPSRGRKERGGPAGVCRHRDGAS